MKKHFAALTVELRQDWQWIMGLTMLALVLHGLLWLAYPPHFGPDGAAYTALYVDAFELEVPVGYTNVVHRMPLAPFLQAIPLSWGIPAYEIVQTIVAVMTVIMVYLITKPWGRWTALAASLLYLGCLPVQIQFHQVAVDSAFLWSILAVCVSLRYATQNMTVRAWAFLGLSIGLCSMVRPNGLLFLGTAIMVLLAQRPWKQRILLVATMSLVTLAVISPWVVYRGIRYDSWTFSRGGWYTFYMTFTNSSLQEAIVKPENGPASQELADLVSEHLLTHPNYTAYDITLEDFFRYRPEGRNFRFYQDAVGLSDYYVGYDTDYRLLKDVAREAIEKHPDEFFTTVRTSISASLFDSLTLPVVPHYEEKTALGTGARCPCDVLVGHSFSPVMQPAPPSEGELIASSIWSMWDNRPADFPLPSEADYQYREQRLAELHAPLFTANGSHKVGDWLHRLWNRGWLLRPIYVYFLAALACLLNRRKSLLFLLMINGAAVVTVIVSAALAPYVRYRMAVEPIFLLSAVIGIKSLLDIVRTRHAIDPLA